MNQDEIVVALNSLADGVHQTAVDRGWHEEVVSIPVLIALIHSEASEALEADRKHMGNEAIAEELADIVIRVLDAARTHGLDIAQAIISKAERNRGRAYRHGGKKY